MNSHGQLDRKDIERLATIEANVSEIKRDVCEMKQMLKDEYVTQAEFGPVRKLVYGATGLILMGFLGGAVLLIWG